MINKWIYYSGIAVIVAFISFSFRPFNCGKQNKFLVNERGATHCLFPSSEETDYVYFNIPFTGKSFTGFKEALAFKESQGQYRLINSLGYLGKYQFGIDALRAIGINNTVAFLNNPNLQEIAFRVLLSKNKSELKDEIEAYEGKVINGITITESGILAAAHLGGAGSVKKFLKSNGKRAARDSYGTSLKSYIKKFGGYDTSSIAVNDNAKVGSK